MLMGCSPPPPPPAEDFPLIFNPGHVARAERLVIFVPGALASVEMFAPARGWRDGGFAPAYYRFPGLDGRDLTQPLDIEQAADQIAAFANAHPDKDIALVGYSSGAPIAILAASRIDGARIVPVAAISPAVERAGGLPTLARGASDVVRSAWRAGTLDPLAVWIEYWQILLYGREATPDPAFRQRILDMARMQQGERGLGPPDRSIARAHARKLQIWELPDTLDLSHVRLRIYTGLQDPVFSTRQTLGFARSLGQSRIYGYPGEGHLLYLTQPDVFETAKGFALETWQSAP